MISEEYYQTREYKETEIGAIPTDWDVLPLSLLVHTTKSRDPRKRPDVLFNYIDVSSVSNETNQLNGYSNILGIDAPSRARRVVHAGDTIFATVRPYLRNIAQIPELLHDSICSTGFCVIRANHNIIDPDFMFYSVLTEDFVSRIVALQKGSSYPAVSNKDVLSQHIAVPPLPEQHRIATVLNTIQEAIAAQDDLIAEVREFKRSLMQRLFTYGVGSEPAQTQETEIGEIPADWTIVTLGEVTKHSAFGPRFSGDLYDENGNVATLRTTDLNMSGHIDYVTMPRANVEYEKFSKHFLEQDDFLVSRSGTCGIAAVFNEHDIPVLPGAFLIRLRLESDINPYFLREYFNSALGRKRVLQLATGAVQLNISGTSLKALPVPLPPLKEQNRIYDILRDIDEKIAVEEDCKTALQDFFKTMLHELMTGRTRLLSDEKLMADNGAEES